MAMDTNFRIQLGVLVMGCALLALKATAWWITGSHTIGSDALESIVNVTAGAFALYSLALSAKPRDREHPYGHGKVEFISAAVEGGLVALAGGLIIHGAIRALLAGSAPHDLGTGIALTAVSGAINLAMGLKLKRRGRKVHSITMEASGTHLLSDAWSTTAMITGLVVIKITGITWLDQVFALVFALYIIYTGVKVLRRSLAGIMDEADPALASQVLALLEDQRRPAWVDVHNLRMIQYGPVLHIDCHVTLPWYYQLEKAHSEIKVIESVVDGMNDRKVEFFIHMDPCRPTSCAICALEECPERVHPFQRRIPWDLHNAVQDHRHRLEQARTSEK